MAHDTPGTNLDLPVFVTGPSDITRLRREASSLDEYMEQAGLRPGGHDSAKLPRTSRALDELAKINHLNLLERSGREQLQGFLATVLKDAPVINISFAADPSSAFMAKIALWFRQNVHPWTLLRVGLQPGIGGGCVVRTANRRFDLSLRQSFAKARPLLTEKFKSDSLA